MLGNSGNKILGLLPTDPAFDFARNIFDRIRRVVGPTEDVQNENESPLTPLSDFSPPPQDLSNVRQMQCTCSNVPADVAEKELEDRPPDLSPLTSVSLSPASRPLSPSNVGPSLLEDASINPACTSQPSPHIGELTDKTKTPTSRALKRRAREKKASKRNAKKKKNAQNSYVVDPSLAQKQFECAQAVSTTYSSESFPIASAGFSSLRTKKNTAAYGLDYFVGPQSKLNFSLRKWNGKQPMPILDHDQRVMGVCAGIPKNAKDWDDIQRRAAALLEDARSRLSFKEKEKEGRRGKFPALNVGISHGGGQPYPKVLEQDPGNLPILEELKNDTAFERISGFATGAFSTWAPRLYQYQNDCVAAIIENDDKLRREGAHPSPNSQPLRRNFPKTPWAATALNFGPQTICFKHADYLNLAFGWCCITALGDYDYTKGGHLVLWDLKLVIEFPPGATILIPSSAIHHANTRIQTGEHRYSFTQYSAAGLFRWVSNDFKTVEKHRSTLNGEEIAALLEELGSQLDFGLSLYSTVDEIKKVHNIDIEAL